MLKPPQYHPSTIRYRTGSVHGFGSGFIPEINSGQALNLIQDPDREGKEARAVSPLLRYFLK